MRYYYDLHIHSALSPCGDDDMTPNNIVNMSLINELDIIALSDHNTCKNVRAVKAVADKAGIVFIPAMELETAEEIHVLCLFPDVDSAERFEEEIVKPSLPDVLNDERIFGRQQILDENDDETGTDDRYLINATTLSIDEIGGFADNFGGIAVPAHIDKQTKSVISVLGMVDRSMGFRVFELSPNAAADYADTQFSLRDTDYFYIHDSDAHYLENIAQRGGDNFFDIDSDRITARDVIAYLKNK